MGNFIPVRVHVYVSGAVIFAANHNANENEVFGKAAGAMHATTGHGHSGATGDGPKLTGAGLDLTAPYAWTGLQTWLNAPQLPPVGSIIPFYDFNGALTFTAENWAYCNGQTKTFPGIGVQTLPDLSNRYLVGFGTEAGADIGSAVWSVTPVGNASHTVSLQHSHTVNAHSHTVNGHSHTVNAHSHTVNSHNHDSGTLQFIVARKGNDPGWQALYFYLSDGTEVIAADNEGSAAVGAFVTTVRSTNPNQTYYTKNSGSTGNTGSTAPGTDSQTPGTSSSSPGTDSQTPGTDNQLSTAQTIQPRSIPVRFIMRYL